MRSFRGSTLRSSEGKWAYGVGGLKAMLHKGDLPQGPNIAKDQIHYVETHGTGTILGDSVGACAGNVLGAQRSLSTSPQPRLAL